MAKKEDLRGLPTRERLFELLRTRTPRNADEFDRDVERRCVRELAVMMCDSSGFTRKTHDYGILQFLAVMVRSYDAVIPIVGKRAGSVISHGADNLLAVFPTAEAAADAALEVQALLAERNASAHDRDQFRLCIGLHWGKVLRLKDEVYGDKVNICAKIGEDLASADEILATGEFVKRLPKRIKRRYSRSSSFGGKTVELHILHA